MTPNGLWNSDFEDGTATGWTISGSHTLGIQPSGGSQGAQFLRATVVASGQINLRSPYVRCVEGHKVRWAADLKQATVAGSWNIRTSFYDAAKVLLSDTTSVGITLTTGWVRYVEDAHTVPADACFYRVFIFRGSGPSSGSIDVDGVMMRAQHPDATGTIDTTWEVRPSLPSFLLFQLDDTPLNVMPMCGTYEQMRADGTALYFDTIATICGPSRAATFTGQPAHVTGVDRNDMAAVVMRDAGFEPKTYMALLRGLGNYHVGYNGKWNNGATVDGGGGWPDNHCPPGIDDWFVNEDDSTNQYGDNKWSVQKDGVKSKVYTDFEDPDEYTTTMQQNHALQFITDRGADPNQPWIMVVNFRSTHDRPAGSVDPEDPGGPDHPERHDHRPLRPNRPGSWPPLNPDYEDFGYLGEISPGVLRTPDDIQDPICENVPEWEPCWNVQMNRALAWHKIGETLTEGQLDAARERSFEMIRQLQAVSEVIDDCAAEAVSQGFTSVHQVLWSDNGMREGWHALAYGKQSPYRHDMELPLVWTGPGVDDGVDYYGDSRIIQQLDLLPTLCDIAGIDLPEMPGRSLLPFLTSGGPDPDEWRKTGFIRFQEPGEGWNKHLDKGEPGGYAGLHSRAKMYTQYTAISALPASTSRAEFYFMGAGPESDPAQLNNIYTFATTEQREAINEHLTAYYSATGDEFWAQGLIELAGPEGEEGDGDEGVPRRLIVNDEDLSTAAYNMQILGPLMHVTGRYGQDQVRPGFDGTLYVPGTYTGNTIQFSMWAQGCNPDGSLPSSPGAAELVRTNLDFLDRVFDVDTIYGVGSLIPVIIEYRDGETRSCKIHVRSAVDFTTFGSDLAKFVVVGEIPEAFWNDGSNLEETVLVDFDAPGGSVRFEAFGGGTAPMNNGIMTIGGKMPGLKINCGVSNGTAIEYLGDLDSNEQLRLNLGQRIATWTSADGSTTEDHTHLIRRLRGIGGGPWLRLVPGRTSGVYRIECQIDDDPGINAFVKLRSGVGRWFKRC